MSAIGAFLTVICCFGAFALPRRLAALSIVVATLYMTQAQAVQFGLNLMAVRFVELAAFIRIIVRGELAVMVFTVVDRWLLIFFSTLIAVILLRTGSLDVYQFGGAVDAWLVFFSFRTLIPNLGEFEAFLKGTAYVLVPFALLMTYEATTGHNLFAIMGGVPDTPILREGHYRCQGSFRVAITAGTVGATFISLFIGSLFGKSNRFWASVGISACVAIIVASRSSAPLMAAMTVAVGWACWFLRHNMKLVRRGIVAAFIVLYFSMNAPIWFIFDRLSGVLGGDGWHRSNLIDKFYEHSGEWALAGMSFLRTSDWAATQLPTGGVDVTDYYVSIGITGGLISLVFFLILLVVCFKIVGRAEAMLREELERDLYKEAMLWGVGCAVCAHVVTLTSVIYWDQSYVIWYLHLALAVSLSVQILSTHKARPSSEDSAVLQVEGAAEDRYHQRLELCEGPAGVT